MIRAILKKRTIVRKTVPYSTIFTRKISMKLQDKHRNSLDMNKTYAQTVHTLQGEVSVPHHLSIYVQIAGTETTHYNKSKIALVQELYTPLIHKFIDQTIVGILNYTDTQWQKNE